MKKILLFICVFSLTISYSLRTYAQDITLVKDINDNFTATNPNSSPFYLKFMRNNLFFTASKTNIGHELWVYNTITKEVKLVKDLYKGPESGFPTEPTEFKGSLYFTAKYQVAGEPYWAADAALWKTDGTREGTSIVKRFNSEFVRKLIIVGDNLFFTASDGVLGEELWKSDGTTAGTVLVKDIYPGDTSSFPSDFAVLNNEVYFIANDGTNGSSLWRSDGTEAGTYLIKDILLNVIVYGSPNRFIEFNDELYFNASDGNNGYELWKTNGTEVGTSMVKDINVGEEDSKPGHFAVLEGNLYFSADNGTNGIELWKTNGTTNGTTLVKDIYSGNISGNPSYLSVFSGNLYFAAQDENHGFELWKSDGTTNGTQLFKDIALNNVGSHPRYYTEVAGNLYFSAYNQTNGTELWKTDGTANGTTLVKDINDGNSFNQPKNLTKGIDNLYFVADDGNSGYEVWKSDGTEEGTIPISNLKLGNDSSSPNNITNTLGSLFFTANDGINGIELWKSNGTEVGTSLVKDIKNGIDNSSPNNLTDVAGSLFFVADDGINGIELWKSNGTAIGTNLLKDINIGISSSIPNYLTKVNDNLFFTANDGVNGNELWKSDGTEAGTTLVKDIKGGNSGSFADNLTEFLENLYFTVNDGINGKELWKSDGTTNGTELLKDIKGGNSSSSPRNLTKVGDNLFFVADDGTNGNELWKSDGTTDGTELLKDIYSGNSDSSPYNLTEVGNNLYFTADDGINGTELWKSDGTTNGTTLLKDIQSGNIGGFPNNLIKVGGNFYFTANDGINGTELWKSNGTTNGTYLVKDINPGLNDSSPNNLIEAVGILYFTATTANGLFLFRSDGTELGTKSIGYLNSISSIKEYNNEIYIVSFTEEFGEELYKYNPNNNTFFKTGNWSDSSNWSKGVVPDNTSDAIIKAYETATMNINNASIKSMTINKYAKVIIGEDKDLTITNNLTTNDALKIKTNASLTVNGDLDQGANIQVESFTNGNGSFILRGNQTNINPADIIYWRYVSGNNWHLFSSPATGIDIDVFAAATALAEGQNNNRGIGFYDNNANPNWSYYQDGANGTGNFIAGKGYSIQTSAAAFLILTGKLKDTDLSNYVITENLNGWNLVGNPYPANINANVNADANENFLTENAANLDPAFANIYLWDPSTTSYEPIGNGLGAKYIAPGQGFFVKSKNGGGTIDINKSMLTHQIGNLFLKENQPQKIVLKINDNTNASETTIAFKNGMTKGLDITYDAAVFNGESRKLSLYTNLLEDGKNVPFAIQFLPELENNDFIIPLGIEKNQDQEITISLKETTLSSAVKIYLEDKLVNTFTEISKTPNYTFSHQKSANEIGRFYLHIQKNALSIENIQTNNINIYKDSESSILINGVADGMLNVYSITGKNVIENRKISENEKRIQLPNLAKGVYLFEVKTNSRKIVKKIIF